MKPKIIVIAGPTACGKTSLSIELAKKINGEIISSDSMQIYKDMDVGTAKVTTEEAQGIKHYLIDCVSPDTRYSVSDFKKDASSAIEEILAKGKTPIIVGGTGLYIDSLIYNIDYSDMEYDEEYRNSLLEKAKTEEGLKELYNQAIQIDPESAQKISPNDVKRITRILEIKNATGKTKTELEALSRKQEVKYDYNVFVLNMPRDILYERINLRVDIMIKQGLVQEVKDLLNKYGTFITSMQAIGYKEVVEFLDGKISEQEMIEKIKQSSRHYAKRQITWFKKDKSFTWLDAQDGNEYNVNKIIQMSNINLQ